MTPPKEMRYREADIPSGKVGLYVWECANNIEDWMEILSFELLDDIVTHYRDDEGNYCTLVKTTEGALHYTSPINQEGRLRDFLMELSTDLAWRTIASYKRSHDAQTTGTVMRGSIKDPFLLLEGVIPCQ